MNTAKPRSGYTLPVFACAAAVAAWRCLHQKLTSTSTSKVTIDLVEPPQTATIAIEQVAQLSANQALAITRSDPGDNLDLTFNTPIWVLLETTVSDTKTIIIEGGEGIGRQINKEGEAAIYGYAQKLIHTNLHPLLLPQEQVHLSIILPEGRRLAQRTANAAFGVMEGLSLLGTSGIAQPLSAPGQLEVYLDELKSKAKKFDHLVFCIGENGLDLARKLDLNPQQLLKTANWLGSMLVAGGVQQLKSILLFGYHGKLIKLAGGIFHTHHHLADGRLEVLTAHCAKVGLPTPMLQRVLECETTEAALQYLQELDEDWVSSIYHSIATTIERRSQDYIYKHCERKVAVGSVLFNRQRKIIISSPVAKKYWQSYI